MQASHRVAMNTGILYARMAITVFISLYTTRVILNALGAEDFGIFNIVGGAIAMLTFLNASMAAASQRFMSFAQGEGDEGKQKNIFNASVILHAVIALLVLIMLQGVGWILFQHVFKIAPERIYAAWMVYQFAAISTIFTILSVPYDAVINARENMLLFALLGVIEAILKLVVALLLVHTTEDKLIFYGFWMAGITIFLMMLRVAYCHVKYPECVVAPVRYFSKPLFREMTSFAGWSLLGNSSGMIAKYAQGTVMNKFFGTTVNAAHGISDQVSGQLGAFATTMLRALNPMIAKSEGAGDRKLVLRATSFGTKLSFILLLIFYIPVLIEMPYIFDLWLQNTPGYAVEFCRLLLLRNLVEQLYIPLWGAITAVGDLKRFQITYSVLSFMPLIASYALFSMGNSPQYLYVAFLIYSVLMLLVMLWFGHKLVGLNVLGFVKQVAIPCVISCIVIAAASIVPTYLLQKGSVRLISVLSISFVVCMIVSWFLVLDECERNQFQGIGSRVKSFALGVFR